MKPKRKSGKSIPRSARRKIVIEVHLTEEAIGMLDVLQSPDGWALPNRSAVVQKCIVTSVSLLLFQRHQAPLSGRTRSDRPNCSQCNNEGCRYCIPGFGGD